MGRILPYLSSERQNDQISIPRIPTQWSHQEAVSSISIETLRGAGIDMLDTGIASNAWDVANNICVVPMVLKYDFTVTQMFVFNGATVSGSFDMGVYDSDGSTTLNKIVSTGPTVQTGTTVIQTVDVTDTVLAGRKRYNLVFGLGNITATTVRANPAALYSSFLGVRQNDALTPMASNTLPDPLVTVVYAMGDIPVFGIMGAKAF
jgi:hypothetical protein